MQYSIVLLAQVLKDSESFRLDSEFFRTDFLEVDKQIISHDFYYLGKATNKIDVGFVGSMVHAYAEQGIPLLQTQNIKEFFIDYSNVTYIQEWFHKKLSKSQIHFGDILIARSGSFGKASIYIGEQIINSSDIIIVKTDEALINKYYLVSFLNSHYGINQLFRFASGGVQGHVNLTILEQLKIPILADTFQKKCEVLILEANRQILLSQSLYHQAEEILLNELGLLDWQPKHELTFIGSFAEAEQAKRLDAEYFQPKYAVLINTIEKTGQSARLGDCLKQPIQRGLQPDYIEDGEIPVINSKHVGKTHVLLDDNRLTSKDFAHQSKNRRGLIKQYDVLMNSTGYITIGRCQVMLENMPVFADGHVSIIRPKPELDPVYLAFFLNAITGQMQTEKGWTGSSGQIELRQEVIADYTIWKAPDETQKAIRKYVEDSHQMRENSKHLLEIAKRAVEIAIEQNESAAEKWLRKEVQKLNIALPSS